MVLLVCGVPLTGVVYLLVLDVRVFMLPELPSAGSLELVGLESLSLEPHEEVFFCGLTEYSFPVKRRDILVRERDIRTLHNQK